ncbi:MAG TPA: hypothetical protein VHS59_01005, partial [Bacillota bacterium]|nr:hypothetical protein [Bacillota bacterium]
QVSPSLLNAPQYVANNLRLFDQSVIRIQLTSVQEPEEALNLLEDGKIKIITGGPDLAIQSLTRSNRLNIPIIAQLSDRTGLYLLSRNLTGTQDTPPRDLVPQGFTWADLKGRTIVSYPRGSIPHMVLSRELRKQGMLPQKSLTLLQNIPVSDLGAAFVSGSGDYLLALEPLASSLEFGGTAAVVTGVYGNTAGISTLCAMTHPEVLKQNPQGLQAYVNGLFRAQRWLASHTAGEITAVLRPDFKDYSQETLFNAVYRYKSSGVWAGYPLPEEQPIRNLQELMTQTGELKDSISFRELAETKFARAAARQ